MERKPNKGIAQSDNQRVILGSNFKFNHSKYLEIRVFSFLVTKKWQMFENLGCKYECENLSGQ